MHIHVHWVLCRASRRKRYSVRARKYCRSETSSHDTHTFCVSVRFVWNCSTTVDAKYISICGWLYSSIPERVIVSVVFSEMFVSSVKLSGDGVFRDVDISGFRCETIAERYALRNDVFFRME